MNTKRQRLVCILLLSQWLLACGQKGPLTLPQTPQPNKAPAEQPAPADQPVVSKEQ
ncbi:MULTISPECIES: LPS translocon maturation chaperone LptM [Rheinheimera]|uniref:Lipoprotein n=1 Tax=Rheinheimera tangshanensis TaxID=400153 RepID=A0A5C8LM21_9GAMM|nr:lipoprotein [Rheinheimera faecalis]TXK77597.1 lipoprotein [Rheinheimera tangshanensis]